MRSSPTSSVYQTEPHETETHTSIHCNPRLTELQGVASSSNNGGLDLAASEESVRVRNSAEAALWCSVLSTTEIDIVGLGCSGLLAVNAEDWLDDVAEDSALDECLSAHASVHTAGGDVLVVVVEDVSTSEAEQWCTRADVCPVVVGVGDVELASVLLGVAVAVADERGLVVVVELGVGNGDPVGGVAHVEQTVVVVLVGREVGREIHVVDPDVGGLLDADGIASLSNDFAAGNVLDDDVLDILDVEGDALKLGGGVETDDRSVGCDTDLDIALDGALYVDNRRRVGLGSSSELSQGADSGSSTTGTTSGAGKVSKSGFQVSRCLTYPPFWDAYPTGPSARLALFVGMAVAKEAIAARAIEEVNFMVRKRVVGL